MNRQIHKVMEDFQIIQDYQIIQDHQIMEGHRVMEFHPIIMESAQVMKVNNQVKMAVKLDSLAMKMKIIDPVNKIIKTKIPRTMEALAMNSNLSHRDKAISYNLHQLSNQAIKILK